MLFQEKLKDLVGLFDKWLPEPEDNTQLEHWCTAANYLTYSFEFTDIEQIYVDRIIEMYEEQFKEKLARPVTTDSSRPTRVYMDELLNRKQIEQRTPEWYAQMVEILSASEIGNLFASPRTRAKLVVSKIPPYQPRNQPLAVFSDYMSAFDWGIRFEPVVKLIYEYKYQAIIKELGRLHHPEDKRCTASPDGLIYDSTSPEKVGRLIEIKCPVTREIDGSVPKEYYAQMQMQLQVTGLKNCDYVEACFSSKYNSNPEKIGPGLYWGLIALVRYAEIQGTQEFYYIYSPVNPNEDWAPAIKENEEVVELIPWKLMNWSEQIVTRNQEWWSSIKPQIDLFWEDVEKARRGEFVVPESTRPPKKAKEEKCIIVFNKLNEDGSEITQNPLTQANEITTHE
jgi:hypothetical protein